jgi:D-amino-acid dehydrogenase
MRNRDVQRGSDSLTRPTHAPYIPCSPMPMKGRVTRACIRDREVASPTHPQTGSEEVNVTVIGAGIIGMACATWLQRDGHAVTVVASHGPGEDCSYGNSGLLSPGSVVPPALPGAWRNIPKWLLDPLGPLAIRWRHAPRLLPWLAGWLKACREDRARAVSRALAALHAPVFENYVPLLADAGASHLVQRSGQLYVSEQDDGAGGTALARVLRAEAGVRAEGLSGDAAREIEPALGRQFRCGLYFPDNGHSVNSFKLVQALARHFQRSGGRLLKRTVVGFDIGPEGPRALRTDGDLVPSEKLVIAAGAWSHRLSAQLGSTFPLEAERGYHLMLPKPEVAVKLPLVNRDHNITLTPMDDGLRIGGTAEFAGVDTPPDYRRARVLLSHGRRTLPGLHGDGATEWMGCRPSLPDGLPVIDRSPRFSNVYFAFGHAHFGLTEAPTTGRLIAEMVDGRRPSIPLEPYRATRFS